MGKPAVSTVLILSCISSLGNAFVPRAFSTFNRPDASETAVYGDGNPPPFGDWGQPAAVPPPAPTSPATSSWAPSWAPAPAPEQVSTPDTSSASSWAPSWAPPPPASTPEASSWAQSFPAAAIAVEEAQAAVASVTSSTPSTPAAVVTSPPATSGSVGGDPIAILEASQKQSVDAIAAAIPDLAVKPDCTWNGEQIAGELATLDARDAPGPANIAWLAAVNIPNKLSSLTIFNGPLTDVPHLLSRVAVVDGNKLQFTLDFRPRAYGAYEMVDANGNYPGPETLGRKAFEYSGARNDFDSKFGTDEVKAFMESTLQALEGAVVDPPPNNELELLTRGPLCLSVTMPLTDANVATVAQARAQAAEYWKSWATDGTHEHRPGAPVNTQYVYDSKFKINAYGALLPIYTGLFGQLDGEKMAAAESGPIDEAYVGGGS